jgi:hypothetical protein
VLDFVRTVKQKTGKEVILYGGSLLADLGITDHLGCSALWIARYTATLPQMVLDRIGWDRRELFGWQYAGDGEAYLADYPHESPIGKVDISALTIAGGGEAALDWARRHSMAPEEQ